MAGQSTAGTVRGAVGRLRRDTTVVVLLTAVVAVSVLGVQQHRLSVLTSQVQPQLLANQRLLQAATDMESGVRGYRLTEEAEFLQPYEAAQPALHDAANELAAGRLDPTTRALVDVQQQAIARWIETVGDPFRPTTNADQRRSKAAFDQVRTANADLTAQLQTRREAVQRWATATTVVAVVLLVGLALLGLSLLRRRSRSTLVEVVPPLEHLRDVVDALRRGRSGVRADAGHGVEEIRTVAAAVNELSASNRQQRDQLDLQIALNDEVRSISIQSRTSFDVADIVTESARRVAVGLRADSVWIRAFDGTDDRAARGWAAAYPETQLPRPPARLFGAARALAVAAWDQQTTTVVQAGGQLPEIISDADHDGIVALLDRTDRHSLLIVPVGVGPACLGYLALSRTRRRSPWSEPERQAAQRIGRDLGRSILTARLVARERELVEELQVLDDQKDQFVSTASHELRTPLTAILGHIQLVSHGTLGPVPDELRPSIDAVDRNAQRLRLLIDDLLALSRLGVATPVRASAVDLVRLVDEVVGVQRLIADDRRIRIEMGTDGELIDVVGNAEELERAVANTVGNAVKFSPSDGMVRVEVHLTETGAEVVVADTGMGISEVDQTQLFTRFFRSTNPEALALPGTGLGLSITRNIVTKHGGTVTLTSALGEGTEVRLQFPLTSAGSVGG